MAPEPDDSTQPYLVTILQLVGAGAGDVHVYHDGYDATGALHLQVQFGTWKSRLTVVGPQAPLVALLQRMLTTASEAPAFTPLPEGSA